MAECVSYTPIYGPVIDNPAWDAGYSTGEFQTGDFYYAFSAETTLQGAVAGVNDVDTTEHYSDIDYGFVFADGQVRLIEGGVYVGPTWSAYNPDDLFIIMRRGSTILYLRGFVYNYDTAVYYDPSLPGVPLPGTLMWTSTVPSYSPMQVDLSLFGIGDAVCLLHSGASWSEDAALNTASFTGELSFTIVGSGGFGAASGQFVGELPFTGSATGSAVEGVPNGLLDFKLDFGDLVRTRLQGELGFRGNLPGGATGIMSVYDDTLYRSSNLNGYIRFSGVVSSELFIPTGVAAGEFPILLAGASSEFIDIVYDAGVDGQISFDIAGVGTPTGSGLKNGAAWTLNFDIQGAGTPGATEAEAVLVSELPFVGKAIGSAYPDNKLITAVMDGDIEFNILGVGGALHNNYFQILLPLLGDAPLLEQFEAEVLEQIRVSMALQARLVSLVREFIRITTTPNTFQQRSASVTDTARVVATAIPNFALFIAEQFNIDSSIQATQIIELAEEIRAAGLVQNVYQGVVAVLSALMVSDNKITGGSAEGGTAGVGVIAFGPPSVEFFFTGYWRAGTEIQLSYTTDVGPGYISYVTQFPMDAADTMIAFAAALDAQPLVNAVYSGGTVQMTAQSPATTVQL